MTESKKSTILIVDDEELNTELLQDILTDEGYNVLCASQSEEAWKILMMTENKIKVVLLDRMMPGLDGTEFAKFLRSRKEYNNIQIIMQTSLSSPRDVAEGTDAGANKYLTKPIDEKLLLSTVSFCVQEYNKFQELSEENLQLIKKNVLLMKFLSILEEQSDDVSPMNLISKLRIVMREMMNIKGDPIITMYSNKDQEGVEETPENIKVRYYPFLAVLELGVTNEQTNNVFHMLIIMSKHIQIKTQEQRSRRLQNQLQEVIDTAGQKTLDLIKEIDESTDDMSKELVMQKMKINLLEILVTAGHTNLKNDLEKLKVNAMSGQDQAETQENIDDLLAQFGL